MEPRFTLIVQPGSRGYDGASIDELKPTVAAARTAEALILAEFPGCAVDLVIRSSSDDSEIPPALLRCCPDRASSE